MALLIVTTATFCALIALAALWANSKRFSNQVFSIISIILIGWLLCIYKTSQSARVHGLSKASDFEFWARTSSAVIALLPWAVWLLKGAILSPESPRFRVFLKSLPSLFVGIILMALAYSDSFIDMSSHTLPYRRGSMYYVHQGISALIYAIFLIDSITSFPKTTGIQRIELKSLGLTTGITAILATILNIAGNASGIRLFNRASIPLISAGYAMVAVALTSHYILNTKDLISLAARPAALLGFLVVATIAATSYTSVEISLTLALVIALCGMFVFWVDSRSRIWVTLARRRSLEVNRREVMECARLTPTTQALVAAFERLLCEQFRSRRAVLSLENTIPSSHFNELKDCGAYNVLDEIGAVTPEGLQRRRSNKALSRLHSFLVRNEFGLLMSIPSGGASPRIVALGNRTDNSPFTLYDTQRFENIVELMNNILVHAELSAQAALQAKMEHLAMLSRGLAHDLKNLITPISSFLVYTEGKYPADSTETEVHLAATRSVQIMTEYVREALFFSERLEPRLESTRIVDICNAVLAVTVGRASQRHIVVHRASNCSDNINVDAVLLQRMLVNLVANAIDASAPGQEVILRAMFVPSEYVRFEVIDQGYGIAAENMDRIFEPYFTTKQFGDDVRGFGLGLTICQKIVNLHAGKIRVQSEVGKGTTVTVDLPLAPPQHLLPAGPCLALP